MQIFLSYAREDGAVAGDLAARLRADGRSVFYDRRSLPPGGSFDGRIRREIRRCDLFVFLISPHSVAPGGYALTELGFAEERWPNPSSHVLPVPLGLAQVPSYLKSVTIPAVEGELVAAVVGWVEKLARRRGRRRLAMAVVAVMVVSGVGATGVLARRAKEPPGRAPVMASQTAPVETRPVAVIEPPRRSQAPAQAAGQSASHPVSRSRRFFPAAKSCRPDLESGDDGWWLTCRCPAGIQGPDSFSLGQPLAANDDALWGRAKQIAAKVDWRCP